MSKKIEKIESIQLQLVLENSETKEQIKNPLVVEESKDEPIPEEERIFSILEESIDKKIQEQKREGKLQFEMEVKIADAILGEIHEGQENMFDEMEVKLQFKLVSIYVLASMHMKLHL